jgi:cation-transporting ATPase E
VGVFSVALLNTVIAVTQEIRAKLAMDKVNMLIVRNVTVVRDGNPLEVTHDQIVRGDTIAMKRGDQAVVDGRLIQSNHLELDESLLTGESEPIEKREGDHILSGSFCLSGNGFYLAERLSESSYASEITRAAQRLQSEPSPLQKKINLIVKVLFGIAIFLCVLQSAVSIYRQDLDVGLVRTIATILIGLIPQGLVLTSSVIFAIGIYRISKIGAVIQSFNAIESFAGVRVICMDKTGTITQNKMCVRRIVPIEQSVSIDLLKDLLGTYSRLSSEKNATIRALEEFPGDAAATLLSEFPFSSQRKMSILGVRRNGKNASYVLGASEFLAGMCPSETRPFLEQLILSERLDVYRNLMFGEVLDPENIESHPDGLGQFRVQPLCVVSLSDIVRPDACDVIRQFSRSGIQFKILSGDSASSILATCRDIEWDVCDTDVITGANLEALEGEAFASAVEKNVVFARLKPEHKVKIIRALRARRIHTAMIGDGVNDVPAIREADLGIAMDEGAAITKEVADIILLKNRFALLPEVFEEGNKIVNTVGLVAKLFLTKNFLVIYLSLASALFLLEFPLTPRRVSLFNIFAIGIPAMLIAFTNDSTSRPKRLILDITSFAAVSSLVMVTCGYVGFYFSRASAAGLASTNDAQAMVMVSIMVMISVANFLLIVSHTNPKRRKIYVLVAVGMVSMYITAVSLRAANLLLSFLHKFYEISTIDAASWRTVLSTCVIGSLVLIAAQRLRAFLSS